MWQFSSRSLGALNDRSVGASAPKLVRYAMKNYFSRPVVRSPFSLDGG